MGWNVGAGAAAGGGADALMELWQALARDADAKARLRDDSERTRIMQQNADDNTALRKAQQESIDELRAAQRKAAAQQGAQRVSEQFAPGDTLDPSAVEALKAGDLGGLARHDAADLTSTAISGIADATAKAPMVGRLTMREAGRPERDTYLGTAAQRKTAADQETLTQLANDPSLPANVRGFLRIRDAVPGGAIPAELFKGPEHSAAYKEYQDAVGAGYKGSFEQYQTQDANRKRPVVNVQGQQTNTALKLADDYARDSKDFATMNTAIRRVAASAKDPSAAGDMALLYAYMKILDPNSVVRESEFATAAKSGSLPQQIQAAASKVINGQRLTPEQRADFVARSVALYNEAKGSNSTLRGSYSDRAKKFGVDPSLIFTELGEPDLSTLTKPGGGGDPLGIR